MMIMIMTSMMMIIMMKIMVTVMVMMMKCPISMTTVLVTMLLVKKIIMMIMMTSRTMKTMLIHPFPNDKFQTLPNLKSLQTAISNLMKMAESFSSKLKTLWEKEKLLVTSNFSFSHSVFKRLALQIRKNQGLFGKGLIKVLLLMLLLVMIMTTKKRMSLILPYLNTSS